MPDSPRCALCDRTECAALIGEYTWEWRGPAVGDLRTRPDCDGEPVDWCVRALAAEVERDAALLSALGWAAEAEKLRGLCVQFGDAAVHIAKRATEAGWDGQMPDSDAWITKLPAAFAAALAPAAPGDVSAREWLERVLRYDADGECRGCGALYTTDPAKDGGVQHDDGCCGGEIVTDALSSAIKHL